MIKIHEVEQAASLARIRLTTEEKEKFRQALSLILDYVKRLTTLEVEGVLPTSKGGEGVNIMRADQPGVGAEQTVVIKMLAQAPRQQDNFLKVKSVLHRQKS